MIKKRNLDNSLIQWIMTVTGLGPGVGELFYVAPAASATSQYRTQLQKQGVERDYEIHTKPSLAYANMVTERNDVMLVAPGAYLETAEIAWSKSHTHMLGLGGHPQHAEWSIPNVSIYSTGTGVVQVLNLTGHYDQFHDLSFSNYGSNAACLSAVTINGYGNCFKFVDMIGAMLAAQIAVVAASSLYFGANGANTLMEDCNIGSNAWAIRTVANSGVIRYTGTAGGGGPSNSTLRRSNINSRAETNTIAMVALPANNCCARGWLYDQCHFNNFWINHGGSLLRAFYDACGTTHDITLRNCSTFGITEWQTDDRGSIYAVGASSGTAAGIGVEQTAS